ncbi:YbfB/YjiJ family MFS transporter [Piscinibacter sp.]|uniref:YbfB/YjiJ family MFS transporter n=1 Tax=Piscinibacter sp. TaxID=1903157 RepID=UPI0039E223D8
MALSAAPNAPVRPLAIALAGLLALATAMGIGRFAFTPLLPMMLHDGLVDLPGASWLATANYLGYWLGAMACALQPALWRRWGRSALAHTAAVRAGLVATVLLTLAMALPLPALWPSARFLAGVASAFVFVYVSGWCLARLAALSAPALTGIIFVGPGLGISASGLAAGAMVAQGVGATTGWAVFALLAALLTAIAWPHLRGAVAAPAADDMHDAAPPRGTIAAFTLAYGLAGFGYIVTATFLPVIARQALPGSVWLDLFWPLFGLGVAIGALMTLRVPARIDRRHLLMACYAMQAAGVLLSVWLPTLAGFAFGSLLLGLPFTAITLFAMQEARRLRPHGTSALIGLLTAAYGLGQIAGPPMVAWLLARTRSPAEGFALALETAAAALLAGLAIYGLLARRQPLNAAECRPADRAARGGGR